MLAHHQILLGL